MPLKRRPRKLQKRRTPGVGPALVNQSALKLRRNSPLPVRPKRLDTLRLDTLRNESDESFACAGILGTAPIDLPGVELPSKPPTRWKQSDPFQRTTGREVSAFNELNEELAAEGKYRTNLADMMENVRVLRVLSEVEKAVADPKTGSGVQSNGGKLGAIDETLENETNPNEVAFFSPVSSYDDPPSIPARAPIISSPTPSTASKNPPRENPKFNTEIFKTNNFESRYNSREPLSQSTIDEGQELHVERWDHLLQLERRATEASLEGLHKVSLRRDSERGQSISSGSDGAFHAPLLHLPGRKFSFSRKSSAALEKPKRPFGIRVPMSSFNASKLKHTNSIPKRESRITTASRVEADDPMNEEMLLLRAPSALATPWPELPFSSPLAGSPDRRPKGPRPMSNLRGFTGTTLRRDDGNASVLDGAHQSVEPVCPGSEDHRHCQSRKSGVSSNSSAVHENSDNSSTRMAPMTPPAAPESKATDSIPCPTSNSNMASVIPVDDTFREEKLLLRSPSALAAPFPQVYFPSLTLGSIRRPKGPRPMPKLTRFPGTIMHHEGSQALVLESPYRTESPEPISPGSEVALYSPNRKDSLSTNSSTSLEYLENRLGINASIAPVDVPNSPSVGSLADRNHSFASPPASKGNNTQRAQNLMSSSALATPLYRVPYTSLSSGQTFPRPKGPRPMTCMSGFTSTPMAREESNVLIVYGPREVISPISSSDGNPGKAGLPNEAKIISVPRHSVQQMVQASNHLINRSNSVKQYNSRPISTKPKYREALSFSNEALIQIPLSGPEIAAQDSEAPTEPMHPSMLSESTDSQRAQRAIALECLTKNEPAAKVTRKRSRKALVNEDRATPRENPDSHMKPQPPVTASVPLTVLQELPEIQPEQNLRQQQMRRSSSLNKGVSSQDSDQHLPPQFPKSVLQPALAQDSTNLRVGMELAPVSLEPSSISNLETQTKTKSKSNSTVPRSPSYQKTKPVANADFHNPAAGKLANSPPSTSQATQRAPLYKRLYATKSDTSLAFAPSALRKAKPISGKKTPKASEEVLKKTKSKLLLPWSPSHPKTNPVSSADFQKPATKKLSILPPSASHTTQRATLYQRLYATKSDPSLAFTSSIPHKAEPVSGKRLPKASDEVLSSKVPIPPVPPRKNSGVVLLVKNVWKGTLRSQEPKRLPKTKTK